MKNSQYKNEVDEVIFIDIEDNKIKIEVTYNVEQD